MLSELYPDDHEPRTTTIQHLSKVEILREEVGRTYFKTWVGNYRKNYAELFPMRKKAKFIGKLDKKLVHLNIYKLVNYQQAVQVRKYDLGVGVRYASVLQRICECREFFLKWEYEFDRDSEDLVFQRVVGKIEILAEEASNNGGVKTTNHFGETKWSLIVLEQDYIREQGFCDIEEFKGFVSKRVLRYLEWLGVIPEWDLTKWAKIIQQYRKDWQSCLIGGRKIEMGEINKQENKFSINGLKRVGSWGPPVKKQKIIIKSENTESETIIAGNTSETWLNLDELDTSDEEWEDDEYFGENSENFEFGFRKWYSGKNIAKTPTPSQLPKYVSVSPHLQPGSYLDYKTWEESGFDGLRKWKNNRKAQIKQLRNSRLRMATKGETDNWTQDKSEKDTPEILISGESMKQAGNREINKLFAIGSATADSGLQLDGQNRKNVNYVYDYAKDLEAYNEELHQEKVNLARMRASTKKVKDYLWAVESKRRAKNIKKYIARENQKSENPDKIPNWLTCYPWAQKPVYVDKMYTGPKINMTDDFMAGPGLKTEFWKKDVGNDGKRVVKAVEDGDEGETEEKATVVKANYFTNSSNFYR